MTTQNAGEMTVAECQAWLAARHRPECEKRELSWFDHDAKVWLSGHPVPATLDEAAILPEGVRYFEISTPLSEGAQRWAAYAVVCIAKEEREYCGKGTTELEARFRLRVAVEMAERSKA